MPFFENEDVKLFYTSQGDGPPVLLLHGYACDSHDWSFQIPFLLSLGFRVIAVDQRGHGHSSAPKSLDSYSLQTFAADAKALLAHLGCGPVVFIGHSMGGVIASIFAVEYPDAVKALVIVHPIYGSAPPALRTLAETVLATPDRAAELANDFFSKVMYKSPPAWLKTWQSRRLLGTDTTSLVGSINGLVATYGTVMGQTDESKAFLRRRKAPRLAMCTSPTAKAWEEELGIEDGKDEVHEFGEGVFSHMIESEKFNQSLEQWMKKQGLVSTSAGGKD